MTSPEGVEMSEPMCFKQKGTAAAATCGVHNALLTVVRLPISEEALNIEPQMGYFCLATKFLFAGESVHRPSRSAGGLHYELEVCL
jgi:hypothetical protein